MNGTQATLLEVLSYTNNIAAISSSQNGQQNFLNSIAQHAAEVGLSIIVSKSERMTTDKSNQPLQSMANQSNKLNNVYTLATNYQLQMMEPLL